MQITWIKSPMRQHVNSGKPNDTQILGHYSIKDEMLITVIDHDFCTSNRDLHSKGFGLFCYYFAFEDHLPAHRQPFWSQHMEQEVETGKQGHEVDGLLKSLNQTHAEHEEETLFSSLESSLSQH
ncbi:hypothetical protein CDL12_08922 [Handroanthus impetiginosus]|uniref:Uncharacterized protein n=1 Tax=Handroanthus impetiginosus TaxID=429701 RepID=A0A2G9HLM4_9LAMI|nr:hypothetical protein CDL12_08922 [Handroanthus impetiginosus]